ncbi:hypothetical protein LCGC14_0817410 [marine sediment metagenome]|uniref:Uncharacterized protein n=1 Tax=marine sediment metagenome TaxID=412755 RepID=A0A0F9S4S8_9ZZZZ
MRLTIQSATIERTYRNAETSERRVTLNGRADGNGFSVGDTLPEGHFWAGWKITAATDCGEIHK